MLPLVPLYWGGVEVKNFLYDCGLLRVRRLARPVVSVGSLSAGGAGKTPVVMMLAELLGRHGVAVDVLSRGYGRGSDVVEEVDAAGTAARFGDEPLEMARAGLRVFVGAERYEAGALAEGGLLEGPTTATAREERKGRGGKAAKDGKEETVHLLDDGFQHRQLGRALDVVLLTAADVEDWLLPAGNLREGLRALGRADVVVVREDEAAALQRVLRGSKAEVWVVRRRLEVPVERPRGPVAFCGIARAGGFFAMLRASGCEFAGAVEFGDHHAYGVGDFARLVEAARHAGADGFVTTAKDAVKISAEAMRGLEEVGMVWVARLKVELVDEEAAWGRLRRVVTGAVK